MSTAPRYVFEDKADLALHFTKLALTMRARAKGTTVVKDKDSYNGEAFGYEQAAYILANMEIRS